MKIVPTSRRALITMTGGFVLLLAGLFVGCSDDESAPAGPPPMSSPITVETIIFAPKSPAPGDTMRVTAVVTADTPNVGDFVTYKWTDGTSNGTFLEDNQSSVRWVAPLDSSIDSITVEAKNSVSSSKLTEAVFVGELIDVITERAGELHPLPSGGAGYYLSPPGEVDDGLTIRYKDESTDEEVFPGEESGTHYEFDPGNLNATHVVLLGFREDVSVVYDDLQSRNQILVATENRHNAFWRNAFTDPYVSNNGDLICFAGHLPDQVLPPESGGTDTFNVFVYEIADSGTQRAVLEGENFHPTFSTDGQYLVFVSNREDDPPPVFELYSLPMQGTTVVPDTVDGALVQLTDTGGLMGTVSYPPAELPKEWSPVVPVLAAQGTDDKLRLVSPDGSSTITVEISGRVRDFVWAPGGQTLAVVISDEVNSIYMVNLAGDATLIKNAAPGDRFSSLSFSPDEALLVYSVRRSADAWYEVLDATSVSEDAPSVRITGATRLSAAQDYGPPLQSLRPAWEPVGLTVYLFFLDRATPRVMSLDLSGVVD